MMHDNVAVLLVDDRPENLAALEAVLDFPGLDLVKVESGNDALRLSLKQDFALVLLDVQMPGMSGFETAELMRSNPKTKHLPIIFVTAGMNDTGLLFKGYESGAVDYLNKPFEPYILQSKVKVFCELYRHRRKMELSHQEHLINTMQEGYAHCRMLYEGGQATDFVYIKVNTAFEQLTGLKDVTGKTFSEILPNMRETNPVVLNTFGRVAASGIPESFEIYVELWDTWFSVSVYSTEKEYCVAIFQNITERKYAEEIIRVAAVAFETHEAILITDANANIIRVNHAFQNITGYTMDEVAGKNPRILSSGRHPREFYADMWQQLLSNGTWTGEIWDRRKDGEIYPKWMTITAVKDGAGDTTEYVSIFSDITKRKQTEDEIRNLAFFDTLTQLPNRRLLDDRLEHAIAASKRSGRYGAVMFLDLDNFKPLNDTHGHKAGDLLLVEVARRLASCVREVDTVARFGGDEFVVVLSELDEGEAECVAQTCLVAEKIREALAEPYWLAHNVSGTTKMIIHHHCAVSIGAALFNGKGSAEQILKCADLAMYQAKEAGRNSIRFYDPKIKMTSMK
jgi:diguanylate cyclase (GGDEF)-like protein/PAS domain S-box-containing protein